MDNKDFDALLENCLLRIVNGAEYHDLINEFILSKYIIEIKKTFFTTEAEKQAYDEEILNAGINLKSAKAIYHRNLAANKETIKDKQNALIALLTRSIIDDKQITFDFTQKLVALATKFTKIRGQVYSSIGKRLEKKILLYFCQKLNVPEQYYNDKRFQKNALKQAKNGYDREYDFLFYTKDKEKVPVQVKLTMKENSNLSDQALYERSPLFIVWELMPGVRAQLMQQKINFIELKNHRLQENTEKMRTLLKKLNVPFLNNLPKRQIL